MYSVGWPQGLSFSLHFNRQSPTSLQVPPSESRSGKLIFSPGSMGGTATLVTVLLLIVNAGASHKKHKEHEEVVCNDEKLTIMFTTQFENIWDDKGSDSGGELSIWRPTFRGTGFFPVGDTAVTSHDSPDHAAVLVEDNGNGLVKPPRKFRKIWNDKGSTAHKPLTVYEMVPPSNYTCLGDVVVKSYKRCPVPNMYRCVRVDMLDNGDIYPIWKSKHFGAKKDVSFWTVKERNSTIPTGLSSGSFIAVKSFNKPVDYSYLLNVCKMNLTDTETEEANSQNKDHHHHGADTCECKFHPGGCVIVKPPPANMACSCKRSMLWTCPAEVTGCAQPEAFHCKNPDKSIGTCLQGGGECRAYTDVCDCEFHSGGCRISKNSIPHTACKCRFISAFKCGGEITICKDPTSAKCMNPDASREACEQGNGQCGAYKQRRNSGS
ncbi:uncharacterized protein [Ambystoma mexicanum]|uniref:uncharacterized protein n=1 Tax=Ambystoma mexicanum TaxID=8296 RepID=UPI0037E8AC97